MRIVKEADERKNEILDAAGALFMQKGFDGTSTNDILDAVGIARGTLYYHFKSKEDIMDALIERTTLTLIAAAREIAANTAIPVIERLLRAILAMNVSEGGGKEMLAQMHKPQNALMHQKAQKVLLSSVTPILAGLIQEGIEQGLFHTPFPYACMEMVIIYANTVFDEDDTVEMTVEERQQRIEAFCFNMERLLGTSEGFLIPTVMQMFAHE